MKRDPKQPTVLGLLKAQVLVDTDEVGKGGSVRSKSDAEVSFGFGHHRRNRRIFRVHSLALTIVIALLLIVGCGTTHATLDIAAPSTVTVGSPFTVTVTTMYGGSRDTIINSGIHFTSSDRAAVLPPDYIFTPADAGSHTWSNGFILRTPGTQTITAEIVMATGINGTVNVVVSGPSSTQSE